MDRIPSARAIGPTAAAASDTGISTTARRIDAKLRANRTRVVVPPSPLLPPREAAKKRYGDSWTCFTSCELLLQRLAAAGVETRLTSVGTDHWDWGKLGRVDYHYFLCDPGEETEHILDPTFHANFRRPGGSGGPTGEWILRRHFAQAGAELGCPAEAAKLIEDILGQPTERVLIISGRRETEIYRRALELRAKASSSYG